MERPKATPAFTGNVVMPVTHKLPTASAYIEECIEHARQFVQMQSHAFAQVEDLTQVQRERIAHAWTQIWDSGKMPGQWFAPEVFPGRWPGYDEVNAKELREEITRLTRENARLKKEHTELRRRLRLRPIYDEPPPMPPEPFPLDELDAMIDAAHSDPGGSWRE